MWQMPESVECENRIGLSVELKVVLSCWQRPFIRVVTVEGWARVQGRGHTECLQSDRREKAAVVSCQCALPLILQYRSTLLVFPVK